MINRLRYTDEYFRNIESKKRIILEEKILLSNLSVDLNEDIFNFTSNKDCSVRNLYYVNLLYKRQNYSYLMAVCYPYFADQKKYTHFIFVNGKVAQLQLPVDRFKRNGIDVENITLPLVTNLEFSNETKKTKMLELEHVSRLSYPFGSEYYDFPIILPQSYYSEINSDEYLFMYDLKDLSSNSALQNRYNNDAYRKGLYIRNIELVIKIFTDSRIHFPHHLT